MRHHTANAATNGKHIPSPVQIAIGFVTDFFDTLGGGWFATTTAAYKLLHVVSDERLVGTMLIGPYFSEPRLLAVARTYEATTGWRPT